MATEIHTMTNCVFCKTKQYELYGHVADSMLVNTILMLVYVTKFFWWEAGYWNTMDIAHDRGILCSYLSFILLYKYKSTIGKINFVA